MPPSDFPENPQSLTFRELLINGKPPVLPGDSQSLTFREVSR